VSDAVIDEDDLAMLAAGFDGALRGVDADAGTKGLVELGWLEVLEASPAQGIATAFAALGSAGSAAAVLDDVLAHALGLAASTETCVVLPAPGRATAPGRRDGDDIVVDGVVTRRADAATTAVVVLDDGGVVSLDASALPAAEGETIDPDAAHRRARFTAHASVVEPLDVAGAWADAVAAARAALAHQLLGASRTMLDQARDHAVERVQFGRPVGSFQAVRHKLAEALVQIEGAAAVTVEWQPDADPLLAALAKSLAGQAARTSASNAQQVLAGIGFTTDHPFHRWLKRTLVLDALFGSASTLPAEIGAELLARGEAPRLLEL
jgi:alkylation response protein AidB-like acyl-CoA dehydrogenase